MDARVIVILVLEALLALWLLRRAGLLCSRRALVLSVLLLAAAFVLRGLCLDYETLDYQNFLRHWVDFYRDNGGFRAISQPLGNYNIPYLYFLCLFSYLPIRDLYLIKLLSILFDVLLAFAAAMLLGQVRRNAGAQLACFFTVLFLPTVVLNGALWGQCDSIYVALALLGLWLAMEDRPVLSVLCFTLAFGFKLQTVFLLPILAVFWFQGRFKLRHFLLFSVFYVLLVLPAVLLGKPFVETLTLYASQTGSIGSGLNYNSPSIYAFFRTVADEKAASTLGLYGAFAWLILVLALCFRFRGRMGSRALLAASLLLALGIPFLLPHMHDRYFFFSDVLSVVVAFACWRALAAAPLAQFASLLGYHAYLKMRYLLYMDHGARALIGVLLITFVLFVYDCTRGVAEDFSEKQKIILDKQE